MSAPGGSLPPRPAHLPAPPSFPPPVSYPPQASRTHPADYHGEPSRRDTIDRFDDRREYEDRKRRRSDASDDRRDQRPRIEDREERGRVHHAPPPRNPEEVETLVHKAEFAAWLRSSEPAADDKTVQDRFDAYRKRFLSRQLYALFLVHKPSAWFEEKYSVAPEVVTLRERVRREARDGLAEQFIAQVNGGQWDGVSYDLVEGLEDRTELPGSLPSHDSTRFSKPDMLHGQIAVYPSPNQLLIKDLPAGASRVKLEEVCSKVGGFKRLAVGPALEENRFLRSAWVQLDAGTDLAAAAAQLNGQQLPETNIGLQVTINDAALVDKPKIAPEGSNTLERLTKDLDQARRLIILLQAETDGTSRTAVEQDGLKAIDNRMQAYAPADATTANDAQLKKTKVHLDLYLTYLRKVFHTCYYSGSINDSREELEARCIKYLRKVPSIVAAPPAGEEAIDLASESAPAEGSESVDPRNGASGEAALDDEDAEVHRREDGESATAAVKTAEQIKADSAVTLKLADLNSLIWSQGVDARVTLLLERSTTDPVKIGGKDLDKEKEKLVMTYVKHEDEGKFRCKECVKLFKGAEFVKKHVPNKHPELLQPLDTVLWFNNFVLDPLHVTPPAGAPASVNDQLPVIRPQQQIPSAPPVGFPPGVVYPAGFVAPWMMPGGGGVGGLGLPSNNYTPGFVGFGLNPYIQYNPGMSGMAAPPSGGRQGAGRTVRYQPQPAPRRAEPEQRPQPIDTTIGRPEGVRDDPRASKGRLNYNDLDANVPDGEVQLDY